MVSLLNMIPQDLLIEIFLRLDVKTLMRCLCVCKLWFSIIRSQNFINSYESRPSIRKSYILFASSDAEFDTTQYRPLCVNGLIYYEGGNQPLICHPISRKIIPIPQTNPNKNIWAWYLGYDPINLQYKVLSFSKSNFVKHPNPVDQLEVLTLGDEGSWKMIKDVNVEIPLTNGICISGILYYSALTLHGQKFLKFDVRAETFGDFIEIPPEVVHMYGSNYTLMNCQGKIAIVARKVTSRCAYDLWFLEDEEKQEWSKVGINLTWKLCNFNITDSAVVGFVPGTGEMIVTACDFHSQFHVVYVDLKKNRSREMEFQATRILNEHVHAFPDFVESLMFL